MDTLYVILKDIKIENANAEQNAYIIGPPAPISFLGYADAVSFQAANHSIDMKTQWVLPIYHNVSEKNFNTGMRKREISYITSGERDKLLNPSFRDDKTMNLNVTLVMAFSVDAFDDTLEEKFVQIKNLIPTRMLGGTTFLDPNDQEQIYIGRDSGWRGHVPPRLLERSHILKHRIDIAQKSDTIEDLVKLTSLSGTRNLSPLFIGYEQISTLKVRDGQRAPNFEHVFTDPLISAAEWQYASAILNAGVPVWVKKTQDNLFYTDTIQEQYA